MRALPQSGEGPHSVPVLINKNYTRLWIGQVVSLVGDMVFDTTLLLWVATVLLAGKSYAPAVSTAVLVVASAVTFMVGPLAGVFVDRWDKKRTMLAADLTRAGLVAVLAGVAFLPKGTVPVPVILVLTGVIVALTTAVSMFFGPARFVMINDVVPADRRGKASSYGQTTEALATIIGPPLAAPLLIGFGPQWALALNAVSFLVSFVAIRAIQAPPAPPVAKTEKQGVRGELFAGLRLFGTNTFLRALLIMILLLQLGAGALSALAVYYVPENLHADPKWYGFLGGTFGAGILVGAFLGGMVGDKVGHARMIRGGMLVFAGAFALYSQATSLWLALVAYVLLGLGIGSTNSNIGPLLMAIVPREFMGRVSAVMGPANRVVAIVSMVAAGLVASWLGAGFHLTVAGVAFGRLDAVFTVASAFVLAGAVYAFFALRGADHPAAAEPVAADA